jgi:hypothetical protein
MYKFSQLFNKMGMTKKKSVSLRLTAEEKQLLAQLRQHPELRLRFERILEITGQEGAAGQTAAAVEGLLLEELRRLGHTGLSRWAVGAEEQAGREFKEQEPGALVRKKKR